MAPGAGENRVAITVAERGRSPYPETANLGCMAVRETGWRDHIGTMFSLQVLSKGPDRSRLLSNRTRGTLATTHVSD